MSPGQDIPLAIENAIIMLAVSASKIERRSARKTSALSRLFAETDRKRASFHEIRPSAQVNRETIDFPISKVGLNPPNIQIGLCRHRLEIRVSHLAVDNHENVRCTVGIDCS
jgi:hypothetical protein